MKLTDRTVALRLWAFGGGFGLLLIVTAFLLSRFFLSFVGHRQLLVHTHEVINEANQVLAAVKDAETGARGYFLNSNPVYLEPYNQGMATVWRRIDKLAQLTQDNPVQQGAVDKLRSQIEFRLNLLKESIDRFNANSRRYVPLPQASSGQLKSAMDAVRDSVDSIEREERRLLVERSKTAEDSLQLFFIVLGLSTLINVVVAAVALVRIRAAQISAAKELAVQERAAEAKAAEATMAQTVAGDSSVAEVSHKVVDELSHRFGILAANFYVLEGDELRRVASFAGPFAGAEKNFPASFRIGQGLVGEAVKRTSPWEISDVPDDYWPVSSSFGGSPPRHLLLVPVRFQNRPLGVLEAASFRPLSEGQHDLLAILSDTVGVGLGAAQARERVQALLERTQQQAEELQAQQEELRTNNEELEEQARTLEKQQNALENKNLELESARHEIESKATDLERTNQYKSEFLAKMSHELRTPLNSLLILATLMLENKQRNLTDQQMEFVGSMQSAGNDLLALINDILDLSKIEARKLSLRAEPFRVISLMEQMKRTFDAQASVKGLQFLLDAVPEVADFELRTDRMRLEQILRNFLSNAIKFTDVGSVTLRATLAGEGQIAFSVEDTGIGVPSDKRELIFEAFEQADSSVSRRFGGTGLGLTISRELAVLLGGHIELTTEEGQGSCFTVTLPVQLPRELLASSSESRSTALSPPRATPPPPPAPIKNPSAEVTARSRKALQGVESDRKSILIVEDDPAFLSAVADAVRGHGFQPLSAQDGETALEIVKEHVPDAILLDIKLPGVSGLGLLEIFKSMPALRHVPIHVISAMEYGRDVLRRGAAGYIGKPATLETIRSTLSRIENMISRKVKQVLVVEDDARQAEAIRQLVGGDDAIVEIAQSGEEAMTALRGDTFDCMILDLTLPDLSGFALLERLESLDIPVPPVVVYTGKDLSASEEENLRRHADSIILKGAKSPERLLDEVNLFLHRVEALLPEEKKRMIDQLRSREKAFDGRTVLLVDDDLRNLFALTSALEGKGLVVRVARNGIEALQALEEHEDIDIVLMDLMMPKMDGLEATRRIRANPRRKDMPIVALTAKTMKGDQDRFIEAGANDYLPKPINLANLFSVLKVWLAPKGIFE